MEKAVPFENAFSQSFCVCEATSTLLRVDALGGKASVLVNTKKAIVKEHSFDIPHRLQSRNNPPQATNLCIFWSDPRLVFLRPLPRDTLNLL